MRWYIQPPFDGIFTQQYLYQKLLKSDTLLLKLSLVVGWYPFLRQCDCTTTQQTLGISYCNLYVRPVTADAVIALYYGNLFEVISAFLQFPSHIDIVQ